MNRPSTLALQAFVAKHCYPILLLLFLAWMCIGIFPLHCYESDSMHTIAGCSVLYNQGFTVPPLYSYEYHMQPLIYYVVAGLAHVLPFLSCEEVFCLLTGVVAMLNILACIRFVHRVMGIRKEYVLFALFLLPESVAISMYPNTAIFAMLPFVCALNNLIDSRLWPAIAWMSLAPLFRIDILMVYPVILFIFLWQKDTLVAALKKSVVSAVVIIGVVILCYWALQANPLDSTLNGYESWNEKMTLDKNFYAIFSFYTALGILLFPMGVYRLFKQKEWRMLWMVLVPVLLNHIVYGKMGCATKHYLYILPFVALGMTVSLMHLAAWLKERKTLKMVAWTALGIFLVVSVRISPASRPWRNQSYSEAQIGPCLTLFAEQSTPLHLAVGIGAGFSLNTADEKMLTSGNLVYPFYINKLKTNRKQSRDQAYGYLRHEENYELFGANWEDKIYMSILLLADGYAFDHCVADDYYFSQMNKDGHTVTVVGKNHLDGFAGLDATGRERLLREVISMLPDNNVPLYLFTCLDSFIYFFDKFVEEGMVKRISHGFYLIHSPQEAAAQ